MNRQFCSKLPSESDDAFIFNLYSAIESESLVEDEPKKKKTKYDLHHHHHHVVAIKLKSRVYF